VKIALMLMMAITAGAQTAKKPTPPPADDKFTVAWACDREGDTGCVSVLGITKDKHGCDASFQWDEKTGSCTVTITIIIPTAKCIVSEDGQIVTCSYKPAPPESREPHGK